MKYKVRFSRQMPNQYHLAPQEVLQKVWIVMAISKTVTWLGETYSVKGVHLDTDAEIATIELDNGLRPE